MDLNNDPALFSLPNHYIELSRILLEKCVIRMGLTYSCEDDIEDVKEVRSLIDILVKVRESRLNEFRSTVVGYLSSSLEEKFNHGEYRGFVKRPFYDVHRRSLSSCLDHRGHVQHRGEPALLPIPSRAGGADEERGHAKTIAGDDVFCFLQTALYGN